MNVQGIEKARLLPSTNGHAKKLQIQLNYRKPIQTIWFTILITWSVVSFLIIVLLSVFLLNNSPNATAQNNVQKRQNIQEDFRLHEEKQSKEMKELLDLTGK